MSQDQQLALKKQRLRREMRKKRRSFVGWERTQAEKKIQAVISVMLSRLDGDGWIGVYSSFDGEVDLSGLWGSTYPTFPSLTTKFVFPVHEKNQALRFVKPSSWTIGSDPSKNLALAYGEEVPLTDIEVLFVPGVMFCPKTGNRLGLGGGHYDRTLALRDQNSWTLPAFGVGFSFQQQSGLPSEAWDIPLDGLITELGLYKPT